MMGWQPMGPNLSKGVPGGSTPHPAPHIPGENSRTEDINNPVQEYCKSSCWVREQGAGKTLTLWRLDSSNIPGAFKQDIDSFQRSLKKNGQVLTAPTKRTQQLKEEFHLHPGLLQMFSGPRGSSPTPTLF